MDEFQRFQFQRFLTLLPESSRYCVDCLSRLYGDTPDAINGYLGSTAGQDAECGNCGARTQVFRSR